MGGREDDPTGSARESGESAGEVGEDGILLRLPEDARSAFKDPMGPVFTDTAALLAEAGDPLIAVGDAVTYHLRTAGATPDVAVVDGLTQREAVDEATREAVIDGDPEVWNPAATLTTEMLSSLQAAIDADEPRTIVVDGEEDLATLPAVLAAPAGASVVYGQPGEGMVHVRVTDDLRERTRELFALLAGDHRRAFELLGVDPGTE